MDGVCPDGGGSDLDSSLSEDVELTSWLPDVAPDGPKS